VNNTSTMDVSNSAENFINKELDMLITENLSRFDYRRQISFHQWRAKINIVEFFARFGKEQGGNWKDVFMIQQPHDLEFSKCSFGENFMFKCLSIFLMETKDLASTEIFLF